MTFLLIMTLHLAEDIIASAIPWASLSSDFIASAIELSLSPNRKGIKHLFSATVGKNDFSVSSVVLGSILSENSAPTSKSVFTGFTSTFSGRSSRASSSKDSKFLLDLRLPKQKGPLKVLLCNTSGIYHLYR